MIALGRMVMGWVPVKMAAGWRRVEGSLLVGGEGGLEDDGWRAEGAGRVVMVWGATIAF